MKLRKYQSECIEKIHDHFKYHDRQLIQLPTGSGKTFIFLKYLKEHAKKSLIIVPTKELLYQIYENALLFFDKKEIFIKKSSRMGIANHYILTAQSLSFHSFREWVKDKIFDHIVIDEAHRAQCPTYKDFISFYINQALASPKIVGFTATPERLDGKLLLEIFNKLTFSRNFYDLIQQKYLCDLHGYRVKTSIKIDKEKSRDFSTKTLRKLDNDSRNNIILSTIKKNKINSKTLIFCLSVEHSIKLAHALRASGYSAEAIYGKLDMKKRKEILNKFRIGEIKILCNCQLLTEGFDEPSIKDIIIARPTKSKSLYCQMLGRAVRPYPGKEFARVFEITDNSHDICTFDVAASEEKKSKLRNYEYENGSSFSDICRSLKDEYEKIKISEKKIKIDTEKFSFFRSVYEYWEQFPVTLSQKENLKGYDTSFISSLNFLEAAFLIWKNKLRKKYGQH